MRILVTGGAGFIGTHLSRALLAAGHSVVVMDNMLRQVHGDDGKLALDLEGKVDLVLGDVSVAEDWRRAFEHRPEFVFHLAAETGTSQSMTESARHASTNVTGTARLLDWLNNEPNLVKKVVLSSSRAVYGDGDNREERPVLRPVSVYGVSKLAQEQLLGVGCPVPHGILRFQNVYGPGQSLINPYTGLIGIFCQKMLRNEDVEVFDDGRPTRDFVFVGDVVGALTMTLDGAWDNEPCNVGTGESTTILDLALVLRRLTKSMSKIRVTSTHRPGDVVEVRSNADKLRSLGWSPKVSLEDGLAAFVAHVVSTNGRPA